MRTKFIRKSVAISKMQWFKSYFFPKKVYIAPQQHVQSHQSVLAYSGLNPKKEIFTKNVPIYSADHIHQISTSKNPNLPHLVLLHGFGGSGLHFQKIFKLLYNHYQIHALDHFGMGFSSLGNWKNSFNQQEAINYYIDAIQQWRKQSKLDKVQLVGHSFGGYIAMFYSRKYPENIKRLVLLSPAGFSVKPQEQIKRQIQQRPLSSRAWIKFAQTLYNLKVKPTSLFRNYFLGDRMINSMVNNRLKINTQQQREKWLLYMKHYSQRKQSSQKGFYAIFNKFNNPSENIYQILRKDKFNFPIQVYFGDQDWLQKASLAMQHGSHLESIKFSIIPGAGHQMVFDNPEGVAKKILNQKNNE